MAVIKHQQWRKILYASQPFEDNYVDETFLEQMRTNGASFSSVHHSYVTKQFSSYVLANVQEHDYKGMVRSAATITQQICAVSIFYSVFEFFRLGAISAMLLGGIDVFLAIFGFAVLRACFGLPLRAFRYTWNILSSSLLFCATLSLLAPVLRTLTRSYADDTIWALAAFLCLLHLITHDYNYINSGIGLKFSFDIVVGNFLLHSSFSGTISLNAAIFMAVMLSSRLQSNEHVFALVLFAIETFAMSPMFWREVKVVLLIHLVVPASRARRHSERLHLMIAAALFALSSALVWQLSGLVSVLIGAFVLFLAFLCPLWFMHVQESKSEILGPWDITHIQPEQ
ncbi:hypothetical protein CCR75_000097 [Bremia lactucae]|uniref:Phosphatidylinositol N-acetylglucosaminyltransferase n=1 Tax=Bremia lactucae TaxID=4779 RepID=A0A976FHQ5_BRELC|nr:hypothetical protein CCR75_000097 [Bremia lactucae]